LISVNGKRSAELREGIMRAALGFATVCLVAASCVFRSSFAESAEIKLLSAVAMKPALDEIAPGFERSTGHKVIGTYATAGAVRDKIQSGEPFDAALLPTPFMDPLVTQGSVAAGNVTIVARSLISVGVRAGSPKPNISTVAAFKSSMLAAKSISYADPSQGGGSGIGVARVIETLGIAEAMKPKTKLTPGAEVVDLVARGEAEIGFGNTPIFVGIAGVDLVGPIPTELYDTRDFAFKIGIGASAKEADAANSLVRYLLAPDAARIFRAKGVEPGAG
jgi:molybdate transport system substrate-binding protein